MLAAFVLSLLSALPDALLALWLMLLGKGVLEKSAGLVLTAAIGLGLSAAATWFLRTVGTRVQRRFRDKVTIALESHVARLQATVATIAHQERPDYLDLLDMLRNQVFVLDHMYMSVFSTCGWILRLVVTDRAADVDPSGADPARGVCDSDRVHVHVASGHRARGAGAQRAEQSAGAPSLHRRDDARRRRRKSASPASASSLVTERRLAWEHGYRPIAAVRWRSAMWHTLAWAIFAAAYVGAVVFVSSGLQAPASSVLLVLAAGARLSAYIGATVGEIGFLTGFWMYGAIRLAWLEDYAAAVAASADLPVPVAPHARHPLRSRLVRVSGHRPTGARRCESDAAGGRGRRHRRRERRRQDDAREAAGQDVRAAVGRDPGRRHAARAHARPTSGGRGWPARSRISSASSSRRARRSASATCRDSTTRRR